MPLLFDVVVIVSTGGRDVDVACVTMPPLFDVAVAVSMTGGGGGAPFVDVGDATVIWVTMLPFCLNAAAAAASVLSTHFGTA